MPGTARKTTAPKKATTPKALPEFASYKDKEPTPLQDRFSDWLIKHTGYKPDDEHAFREGVRLATALRMPFQAHPDNRAANEEARAARVAAREERQARAAERAESTQAKKAAAAQRKADRDAKASEKAAAKSTTAAKKAPAKKVVGKAAAAPAAKKAAPAKATKPAPVKPKPKPKGATSTAAF